jgi:response regulator RpfG family c-di-GMP phosphodiesterase
MSDKILCVDDEPDILASYQRLFRKQFAIDTAVGGEEGLARLGAHGPYAVVVSDMQMPGMDGIRFLAEVRRLAPATVRMMLTGHSSLDVAVDAVNEGHIFRFLTKPCPADTLAKALTAGIEQYRLVTAEKELLEKTLSGSVKVLTDVLSIVNPTAFGRASRVRRTTRALAVELSAEAVWQVEIAAMLSQVGCVTLPQELLEKMFRGKPLAPAELKAFLDHPRVGRDLIGNIPRLDQIAAIIAYQEKHFDGTGVPEDAIRGAGIPLGARILKVALDFDTVVASGFRSEQAISKLRQRIGHYDPAVLAGLERVVTSDSFEVRTVTVDALTPVMRFAEDVYSTSGLLLISRGQDVTPSLKLRLANILANGGLEEPLRVLVPTARSGAAR